MNLIIKNSFLDKENKGARVEVGQPYKADKARAEKLVENGFAVYANDPEAVELKVVEPPKKGK